MNQNNFSRQSLPAILLEKGDYDEVDDLGNSVRALRDVEYGGHR
jgi:hypothetical protein